MRNLGRQLLSGLTQLIYPNLCWTCDQFTPAEQGPLCATCLPQLTRDPFPTCPRCSSTVGPNLVLDAGCPSCRDQSFAFDGVFRMAPYDGLLRETILRMKHWSGEELAETIGIVWAREMAPRLVQADVVLPMPLHWRRRWWRGFNQSAVLAECLARELRLPVWSRTLLRARSTPHQTQQTSAEARRDNVHNAFAIRPNPDLANKRIILVDDVMTSGATAHEASRALRKHRVESIHIAVLAHGR